MFLTSSMHAIPDVVVCLLGLFLLTASGIIKLNEINIGINWDLVLFIGTAMGFGSIFSETGISTWLSQILIELISPLATSPWLFIPVILIAFFLWRFVDIATFIPTMAIITSVAPEVSTNFNINPLIWIPLLCIAMNSFVLSYTNIFTLVAESNLKEKAWQTNHLAKYGVIYFAVSVAAVLVSIPYWSFIGMFGA